MGYKYAECLSRQHSVTLMASPPVEVPAGAELHSVSAGPCNFNDVGANALMRFELRQAPRAWWLGRKNRFDIVHRVTPSAIQNTSFLPAIRRPFVIGPLLAADRPPDSFEPYLRRASNGSRKGRLRPRRIAAGLARRALDRVSRSHYHLRHAHRILVGTEVAMRHVPKELHARCEPITYSGVEHELFVPPAKRSDAAPTTLLYVGRLEPYKGPELLLRAFAIAARKSELRLRIVGHGRKEYVEFCRQLAKELGIGNSVEFVPPVPRAELPQLYQQADIFCFPTISDTYGIALLEAMSCGCAVLVSDVAGPREIVPDGAGIKLPQREPEQFINEYAETITSLARNPQMRAELGSAARRHVVEHHDWQRIGQRLLAIYEQV